MKKEVHEGETMACIGLYSEADGSAGCTCRSSFYSQQRVSGGYGTYLDTTGGATWYKKAMAWEVAEGILTGKNGSALDGQGTASRAEVATMLMRFNRAQDN